MSALVQVRGEAVLASSLDVAASFGKQHRDVMRSVRRLVEQCEDLARNFARMVQQIEIGDGARRDSHYYEMDRKGFTLLAMGFTGPKALEWKIAYIDAFDRMESALREPVPEAGPLFPTPPGGAYPLIFQQGATPDQHEEHRMKLRTVEAARMAFGAAGARRAWALAGLPDLADDEPVRPAAIAVIAALHSSMSEWLTARTEAAPGHREETQALYSDYVGWARDEGYAVAEILSLFAFGKALTRCGVGSIRSNRMHRIGLRIAT